MWARLILVAFIFGGLSDTVWKVVAENGLGYAANTYLLVFHITALVCAIFFALKNRRRFTGDEILLGTVIGSALVMGGIFSMKAILMLPGIVCFPVMNGASLLLVAVLAGILWRERLSLKQIAGFLLAIAAILLIVT